MLINQLKEALYNLSCSPKDQIEWLKTNSLPVDELVLLFDDTYLPVKSQNILNYSLLKNLEELDITLGKMSGQQNKNIWSEESLYSNSMWGEIRILSQQALQDHSWPSESSL
jgi:hypothetical protein